MENKTKLKIMSLSVEPEMHELLKASSKKTGDSVSKIIRELVGKHLNLVVNDGEEIPIILKVPAELKGDEEKLRKWLDSRTNAIVKALAG